MWGGQKVLRSDKRARDKGSANRKGASEGQRKIARPCLIRDVDIFFGGSLGFSPLEYFVYHFVVWSGHYLFIITYKYWYLEMAIAV